MNVAIVHAVKAAPAQLLPEDYLSFKVDHPPVLRQVHCDGITASFCTHSCAVGFVEENLQEQAALQPCSTQLRSL